jgi:hypothetical protein
LVISAKLFFGLFDPLGFDVFVVFDVFERLGAGSDGAAFAGRPAFDARPIAVSSLMDS